MKFGLFSLTGAVGGNLWDADQGDDDFWMVVERTGTGWIKAESLKAC